MTNKSKIGHKEIIRLNSVTSAVFQSTNVLVLDRTHACSLVRNCDHGNQKRIEVPLSLTALQIRLHSASDGGYSWSLQVKTIEPTHAVLKEVSSQKDLARCKPENVGCSGDDIFTLHPVDGWQAHAEVDILCTLKRSWETNPIEQLQYRLRVTQN